MLQGFFPSDAIQNTTLKQWSTAGVRSFSTFSESKQFSMDWNRSAQSARWLSHASRNIIHAERATEINTELQLSIQTCPVRTLLDAWRVSDRRRLVLARNIYTTQEARSLKEPLPHSGHMDSPKALKVYNNLVIKSYRLWKKNTRMFPFLVRLRSFSCSACLG